MKRSGYKEKICRETVLAAYKGLHGKLQKVKDEGGRFHRHMAEGAKERHNGKISMKSTWFNKKKKKEKPPKAKPQHKSDNIEIECVIFIPHTANCSLRIAL